MASDAGLAEPLLPQTAADALPVTTGVNPQQKVVPVIRVVHESASSPALSGTASLAVSIVILSKTILGAGMAALPKSFALLGLGFAIGFLLLAGYMTHYSIEALALGSIATGSLSYPGVVKHLLGKAGSLVLELCLISRCAGLQIVYVIVAADILAGHAGSGGAEEAMPGLLCDWFGGGSSEGWCSNRYLAAGVVTVLVLVPLVSFKRLSSTAITSWLGLFAVGVWGIVTIILAIVATAKGQAHHMSWTPDWDALGDTGPKIATQLLAVIPIIATAYTCQMTVHFVMKEMRPFTQPRLTKTSWAAVSICTVLFLVVAIGSYATFGPGVPADVLENFSHGALAPIVGDTVSGVFYTLVRLGFLISILANFPMQMWPYRESFSRLVWGHDLEGAPFYALTYLSLAAFYAVGMVCHSIWVPIQFVGATAGALIAFFFPAFVALKSSRDEAPSSKLYWHANAWALIVLGVVQAVTGLAAIFIKPPGGGKGGGGGNALAALLYS